MLRIALSSCCTLENAFRNESTRALRSARGGKRSACFVKGQLHDRDGFGFIKAYRLGHLASCFITRSPVQVLRTEWWRQTALLTRDDWSRREATMALLLPLGDNHQLFHTTSWKPSLHARLGQRRSANAALESADPLPRRGRCVSRTMQPNGPRADLRWGRSRGSTPTPNVGADRAAVVATLIMTAKRGPASPARRRARQYR
jgi:hypothetical protein